MKQIRYCYILFTYLSCLSGTTMALKSYTIKKEIDLTKKSWPDSRSWGTKPAITIWIHGTRLFPASAFLGILSARPGLNPVTEVDPRHYTFKTAHLLEKLYPEQFSVDSFYVFGWTGRLSYNERERAADILYQSIAKKINEYKKSGITPYVRIVSHSHGGNISLNLAHVSQKYSHKFSVDELILLACPVQQFTSHLVGNPMFKRVYSLYSRLDIVQILDPQGLRTLFSRGFKKCKKHRKMKPFFSSRRFKPQKNMHQVKIKINGRALFHNSFIRAQFVQVLPIIVDEIRHWDDGQFPADTVDNQTPRMEKLLSIRV